MIKKENNRLYIKDGCSRWRLKPAIISITGRRLQYLMCLITLSI